jgi:hypothetical protein
MASEKMARLLLELVQKTRAGNLNWETTAAEGVYQVWFRRFTVQISQSGTDYLLAIRNSEGMLIEEASNPQLSSNIPDAFSEMGELLTNARRQALGVDAALDELLNELSEKGS